MRKILTYSALLLLGLVGSQFLPDLAGGAYRLTTETVSFLTMVGLSFIMIHVGYEFHLDKSRLRSYGWDYVVAMTTAGFPWLFAALYFVFVMLPPEVRGLGDTWKETLLIGRFAAPTASGVLFAMLAAAGLSATWMFHKTRVLVIFDDLDTVLLMIPLKILLVGLAWQLGLAVVVMVVLLLVAWRWLHRISLPVTWPWVLTYAVVITGISEFIYLGTTLLDASVPVHIEVLLPAFVLGAIIRQPQGGETEHVLETPSEQRAGTIISGLFMVLVGLSMPVFIGGGAVPAKPVSASIQGVLAAQPAMSAGVIALHVLVLTLLINVGKMFPAFVYRREAHWRERLAVAIGMCPRGEVGAGIIILSLGYGIAGPVVTVAVLSLALNLLLTPLFLTIVVKLLARVPRPAL